MKYLLSLFIVLSLARECKNAENRQEEALRQRLNRSMTKRPWNTVLFQGDPTIRL
jgi:hypothetical protein